MSDAPKMVPTVAPFRAHCPLCGNSTWNQTDNPDAYICTTADCHYVHWLRNEPLPVPGAGQAAADALSEVYKWRAEGKAKRDRVRVLVFALLASPRSAMEADKPMIYLPTVVVRQAEAIDNLIEKIE